ncbi:DNA replication terminus site-binding protein [Vibrio mediterranei]|uniref:DNA replication terminus site-binding protein n=1 Tax=Vibrio mediterranei TaxID=689 RepID=UPI00148D5344|nr:DNA replication terminus site-binding protein [Vibrio mediterranei]NOH31645.1 hypothetical protein [Vibrio mediterranei]
MSSFTDIELLQHFDHIKERRIPDVFNALLPLRVSQSQLYRVTMPESDGKDIACVPVEPISVSDANEFARVLRPYLMPHYRSSKHPFAPRLVGAIQLDGNPEDLVALKEAIDDLTKSTDTFQTELKTLFPKMHKRQEFIRRHFKTMVMRSLYRRLHYIAAPITSARLNWVDALDRRRKIELADIRNILKQYTLLDDDVKAEMTARAERVMNHDPRHQLIHFVAERVHITQNIAYKDAVGESKRKPLRPGLPTLVLGEPPCKLGELDNYVAGQKLSSRKRDNTIHDYSVILPEIGVYQRRLTDKEWAEKQARLQERSHPHAKP